MAFFFCLIIGQWIVINGVQSDAKSNLANNYNISSMSENIFRGVASTVDNIYTTEILREKNNLITIFEPAPYTFTQKAEKIEPFLQLLYTLNIQETLGNFTHFMGRFQDEELLGRFNIYEYSNTGSSPTNMANFTKFHSFENLESFMHITQSIINKALNLAHYFKQNGTITNLPD